MGSTCGIITAVLTMNHLWKFQLGPIDLSDKLSVFNENQFNKTIMTAAAHMNDYDYRKYIAGVCLYVGRRYFILQRRTRLLSYM